MKLGKADSLGGGRGLLLLFTFLGSEGEGRGGGCGCHFGVRGTERCRTVMVLTWELRTHPPLPPASMI